MDEIFCTGVVFGWRLWFGTDTPGDKFLECIDDGDDKLFWVGRFHAILSRERNRKN